MFKFYSSLGIVAVLSLSCSRPDHYFSCSQRKVSSSEEKTQQHLHEKSKHPRPSFEEVSIIAQTRLQERMRNLPAYDTQKRIRELIYLRYKIDIDRIFPDQQYRFETLKNQQAIERILHQLVKEHLEREFPTQMRQKLEQQAKEQYPLYQIGDPIVITLNYPGRPNLKKRGILQGITHSGLIIDDQHFLFSDIADPPRHLFDQQSVLSRRERFLYYHYDKPKEEFAKKIQESLKEKVYNEHGWVKTEKGFISLKQIYEEEILPIITKEASEYYEQMKIQIQKEIAFELKREGLID